MHTNLCCLEKSAVELLHKLEDNIKIYIKKIITEGVDWIQLAEDKDHQRADDEYGKEPLSSMKYGEFQEQLINIIYIIALTNTTFY